MGLIRFTFFALPFLLSFFLARPRAMTDSRRLAIVEEKACLAEAMACCSSASSELLFLFFIGSELDICHSV